MLNDEVFELVVWLLARAAHALRSTSVTRLSPALEQVGYLLRLPVMAWWAVIAGGVLRRRRSTSTTSERD